MEWQLRPTRDLGLPMAKRLASPQRELGLLATATRWCWQQSTRLYLRCFHRLSVAGLERLPEPPFVLVANHASHLDALALSAMLPMRTADRTYPIAAGDTFFSSLPVSAFAAFAVNALPLWRKKATPEDLQTLRARLVEDRLVYILFPEGTRSRDGRMARFKPGMGALVAGSLVPVVPCFLDGAFAAWPPHRRLPRPRRLELRIGAPLSFAELPEGRDAWAAVAECCEAAVRRLGGESATSV